MSGAMRQRQGSNESPAAQQVSQTVDDEMEEFGRVLNKYANETNTNSLVPGGAWGGAGRCAPRCVRALVVFALLSVVSHSACVGTFAGYAGRFVYLWHNILLHPE